MLIAHKMAIEIIRSVFRSVPLLSLRNYVCRQAEISQENEGCTGDPCVTLPKKIELDSQTHLQDTPSVGIFKVRD